MTVSVGASDAPAGISMMIVTLSGPRHQQVSGYATLQSGSAQSGTWAAALRLPAYSAQGEWTIVIQARDGIGQETFLVPSELESMGMHIRSSRRAPETARRRGSSRYP